jgi:hypothetical protein
MTGRVVTTMTFKRIRDGGSLRNLAVMKISLEPPLERKVEGEKLKVRRRKAKTFNL